MQNTVRGDFFDIGNRLSKWKIKSKNIKNFLKK